MGCCGKKRKRFKKRFLNEQQRVVETQKEAKNFSNVETLMTTPDDELNPRQVRIKHRAIRVAQRESRQVARQIRIARRNASKNS